MAANDNFLDDLPFGREAAEQPSQDDAGNEALEAAQVESEEELEPAAPQSTERKEVVRKKKKKMKIVKKKVRRKKKRVEPPVDEEVEEADEPEADEPEDYYDEHAEAEEPENFSEDDETEADEEPDSEEEPDLEEDSPLATLPFATSAPPADSPPPEKPPRQAAPPVAEEDRKVRKVKKKKKKKPSTGHAASVDRVEVNKLWDEFLSSLNQATLIAVYEMGIGSILEFEKYSLGQLSKPRGHLTTAQAKEVETWLREHNIELNQSSVDSPIANIRGAGSRVTRGLRIPVQNITVSDDASVRDKRRARFANTRATM